jgi:hypothetical protein
VFFGRDDGDKGPVSTANAAFIAPTPSSAQRLARAATLLIDRMLAVAARRADASGIEDIGNLMQPAQPNLMMTKNSSAHA